MDILTIAGVLLALVAILLGNILEGGHTSSLVQVTAFLIVVGGTVGAVLVQTRAPTLKRAFAMLPWSVVPPRHDDETLIEQILEWSNLARREGLLGLEALVEEQSDPFMGKGLQLLVDGTEPERIRRMLEVEVDALEHRDLQAAKVFDGLGGYSPTIGIIGAVLGLTHVMNNLADPSKLGPGIAVAFVATVYGVGFANILFLPIGNKLKAIVQEQTQRREMLIEALVSIAEGENPRAIETKLRGFLH